MTHTFNYRKKWHDAVFNKLFVGFKQFISSSEQACARQCAEIIAQQLPDQDIQVLDLGAGDGTVSLAFAEALSKYRHISGYTAIDMSEELVTILKSKEKMFKRYSKDIHFQHADAVTFTPDVRPHLIVAFCSWFGIPFQEILRYRSLLEPGGTLALTLSSKGSITIDLTIQFVEPISSSEELLEWLQTMEISYDRYQIVSPSLQSNSFLESANLNPEAESFFRYLLRRPQGTIEDIIPHLHRQPELYFKTPKDLIMFKE